MDMAWVAYVLVEGEIASGCRDPLHVWFVCGFGGKREAGSGNFGAEMQKPARWLGNWENINSRMWSIEKIRKTARSIGELHAELDITLRAGTGFGRWLLTSDEKAALQKFLRDNLPLPPMPPTPPDPR